MEKITVRYTRNATRRSGENYDKIELGGDWEFEVEDGADIDSEFGKAFIVLKQTVDNNFKEPEVVQVETPRQETFKDSYQRQQSEVQQSVFSKKEDEVEYRTFKAGSTTSDIIEGEAVFLENGRVFLPDGATQPEETSTRTGKRYAWVKIGNRDNIPAGVGGNYARVKSFEPPMINKIVALRAGDHVNVWGHFEHWMGRDSVEDQPSTYMWDFVPERIEKR